MELQGIDPKRELPPPNAEVLALVRQSDRPPRVTLAKSNSGGWLEMPHYGHLALESIVCWAPIPSILPPDKPKGRDIAEVTDRMIEAGAPDQSLCQSLKAVRTSTSYTPPENMGDRWRELAMIINRTLPSPEHLQDWQKDVLEAFLGKRP